MACFHPLIATLYSLSDGKRIVRLGRNHGRLYGLYKGEETSLPCGKCIGCLNARAVDWSVRNYHESLVHKYSSFVTLTYAPEFLPDNGTLVKRHVQSFIKRMRTRLWRAYKLRIRYFAVGEYGARTSRPHYHLLMFGWHFPDRVFHSLNKHSQYLYISKLLTDTWKFGHCTVGDISFNSIKYVSKYITKRVYSDVASVYGSRIPEFNLCSRSPIIGGEFLKRYVDDIYVGDRVVIDAGHKYRVPRAYDKWLEKSDPERFRSVKLSRKDKVIDYPVSVLMDREAYAISIYNVKNQRGFEGDHIWSGPRYTYDDLHLYSDYEAWRFDCSTNLSSVTEFGVVN